MKNKLILELIKLLNKWDIEVYFENPMIYNEQCEQILSPDWEQEIL